MKFKLWGGDPTMEGLLEEYSAELSRLDAGDSEVLTCRHWMDAAQQNLKSEFLGFLPYHTYDRTWGFINLIRHKFCLLLPPERLLPLVVQVRACLDYVVAIDRREALAKDLQHIEDNLIEQLKGIDGNGVTPPLPPGTETAPGRPLPCHCRSPRNPLAQNQSVAHAPGG